MSYSSDHTPILLVFGINHDFRNDSQARIKLKRFENIWLQDSECLNIVKTTWDQDRGDLKGKLHKVLSKVHSWGMATYGNVPMEIKTIQGQLQHLKSRTPTREQLTLTHQLETKLDNIIQKEEQWWAQRAKIKWLQHVDKNSKYFHYKASQRHRKNKINCITNSQGSNLTNNRDIH
jgi:hypothetical protein